MTAQQVDYDFIEKAFKQTIKNMNQTGEGLRIFGELQSLVSSVTNFKAFLVLGGSYQERMMTARSDIDFWVVFYGDSAFKLRKKFFNKLFKTTLVNPAFNIIQSSYPHCHPCSFSVRSFNEFIDNIYRQPPNKRKKRISAGMKIINFGKAIDIDNPIFGNKSEYVEIRKKFNDFWRNHGTDVWDVWGDRSNRLDKVIKNLRRYKGKSLYRNVQLPIQQIATAYGFPERFQRTMSLQDKLMGWVGRPRYAKEKLTNIGTIVYFLRAKNLRVTDIPLNNQNKLKDQIRLFTEHIYKPFRTWIKLIISLRNLLESAGLVIAYFGIMQTHAYLIFSKASNQYNHIKGLDIEKTNGNIRVLANLGKIKKSEAKLLQTKFTVFHEEKNNEGEVIHIAGLSGRFRTHVLLYEISKKELLSESIKIRNRVLNSLKKLQLFNFKY